MKKIKRIVLVGVCIAVTLGGCTNNGTSTTSTSATKDSTSGKDTIHSDISPTTPAAQNGQ